MQKAPIPGNEKERLESLKKMGILDTKPEPRFDRITREAAGSLRVPISTISIIDSNREWYKSCHGLNQTEGSRDVSFCGHAMLAREIYIVEDTTKNEIFADNPMVVGPPFIRFYAGIALHNKNGFPIGVLCVKDFNPRKLTANDTNKLIELASEAEMELDGGMRPE